MKFIVSLLCGLTCLSGLNCKPSNHTKNEDLTNSQNDGRNLPDLKHKDSSGQTDSSLHSESNFYDDLGNRLTVGEKIYKTKNYYDKEKPCSSKANTKKKIGENQSDKEPDEYDDLGNRIPEGMAYDNTVIKATKGPNTIKLSKNYNSKEVKKGLKNVDSKEDNQDVNLDFYETHNISSQSKKKGIKQNKTMYINQKKLTKKIKKGFVQEFSKKDQEEIANKKRNKKNKLKFQKDKKRKINKMRAERSKSGYSRKGDSKDKLELNSERNSLKSGRIRENRRIDYRDAGRYRDDRGRYSPSAYKYDRGEEYGENFGRKSASRYFRERDEGFRMNRDRGYRMDKDGGYGRDSDRDYRRMGSDRDNRIRDSGRGSSNRKVNSDAIMARRGYIETENKRKYRGREGRRNNRDFDRSNSYDRNREKGFNNRRNNAYNRESAVREDYGRRSEGRGRSRYGGNKIKARDYGFRKKYRETAGNPFDREFVDKSKRRKKKRNKK